MSIEDAEVLKLVARLVVGYLDEIHANEAHKVFCETSRHLSREECLAFSQGYHIDTSIGLISIVKQYFYIKNKLNDFIRNCPKTPLIIQLIDTSSFLLRLDLIFKVLKENLQKIDKSEGSESRKRKLNEDELFNISNKNTSTPETVITQCSKRQRISFSKPLITLSANKNEKVKGVDESAVVASSSSKKELNYAVISSPETSTKEDDGTEEDENDEAEKSIAVPPPELLSETVLRKTDFVENLVEIINQTRCGKELETEANSSPKRLTDNDFQEIISKTENDFEDILSEVIEKYLNEDNDCSKQSENAAESKPEEIPLKQRLRPRVIAKKPPISEKKKRKSINIISNEIYTGPMPVCLQPTPTSSTTVSPQLTVSAASTISNQVLIAEPFETQSLVVNLVPIMPQQLQPQPTTTTTTFIPLSTFTTAANIVCEGSTVNVCEIPQNVQIVLSENKSQSSPIAAEKTQDDKEKNEEIVESTQKTPKMPIQTNFLASKCKSTPRRKASHIRILDFNQTPSANRLAAIKEFQTPNTSGIKMDTPGSAPASITVVKSRIVPTAENNSSNKQADKEEAKENLNVSVEIVDESSNSNSISNTPKVAKNRRRRKIEIDSKSEKTVEESPKPMTREEWIKMREEQKSMSVDDRMRILFQQQNDQKSSVKKRKTPKKRQELKKMSVTSTTKQKKPSSVTLTDHQGKKLCAKFKVTSPRKAALLKKSPKKKKSKLSPMDPNKISIPTAATIRVISETKPPTIDERSTESLPKLNDTIPTVNENNNNESKNENESETNDLNRSDTVQEVANLLTNLPETILAKTNSFEQNEKCHQEMVDSKVLMETPLKLDSMSPLPNTPRFAVPLVSIHQETPLTKAITSTVTTAVSLIKVCDILTPSFPITPGFKDTPLKSDQSPSGASASGYSSRRTDYSSCSSYYKPDESEEINQNLELMLKQNRSGSERERNSQSESDGGNVASTMSAKEKVLLSAKKIECPGALERVISFTEESKNIPMPHYTMMDEEGLLSESMLTTASDESSSSFTCSTCSTDPSSDENTLDLLNKSDIPEDRDSEWHCDDVDIEKEVTSNNSLVDEKTGEVRFPLRNWITPKKVEPVMPKAVEVAEKSQVAPLVEVVEEQKEEKKKFPDLEAIKQRTLKIIKSESAVNAKKTQPKLKKSNAKAFKLPAEQPKLIPLTRRDQILQQNLTERPRPTPLKLISSATTLTLSSSSRRKSATPRKTIIIDELPTKAASSPTKKSQSKKKDKAQERKKVESTLVKTPIKPERVSLENITDNAVSHDDHPSLNISTSFNDDSSEEENTVLVKAAIVKDSQEEGSNTFQRTLIAQGFEKDDAKSLQVQLIDEIEKDKNDESKTEEKASISTDTIVASSKNDSESEDDEVDEEDDDEDECEMVLSNALERNVFHFTESEGFKAKTDVNKTESLCPASKLQIDGKIVKIDFSDPKEIFSMEPAATKSVSKPIEKEDTSVKEDTSHKEATKGSESKISTKEIEIDKILTLIHGKH